MEEFVGRLWDRAVTRASNKSYPDQRVELSDLQTRLSVCFRAFGGDSALRLAPSDQKRISATSSLLQKIAGTNGWFFPASNNQEVVSLPPVIDRFPQQSLNESLYYYLVALAAQQTSPFQNWFCDNQQLTLQLHRNIPGFKQRYQVLLEHYLPQRPNPDRLPDDIRAQELAIQQALIQPGSVEALPAACQMPVPVLLWLYPAEKTINNGSRLPGDDSSQNQAQTSEDVKTVKVRKKAERVQDNDNPSGLLLFRLENLFSWAEYSHLDRNVDDSEDDDVGDIARDLDVISVSQKASKAARVKFDLDLPAEAFDDAPLGSGIHQPEWNYKTGAYLQDHCLIQPLLDIRAEPSELPISLQATAKRIRSQFEMLQPQRYWQHKQTEGEEIDMDALLSFYGDQCQGTGEQRFYKTFSGKQREMCCLILADLSMSTSAHVTEQQTVLDLIKDSVMLFSEALSASRDEFAIYGFSSARRHHVRFNMIKNFTEPYGPTTLGRIQSLKPGFYTRMGAAIRQANDVLSQQHQKQRILMLISDGKPNDVDHYEGRYGIEDTRQAVIESRKQGVIPFCITIDREANDYLPYIFGSEGYVMVSNPQRLPQVLPLLYSQITRF